MTLLCPEDAADPSGHVGIGEAAPRAILGKIALQVGRLLLASGLWDGGGGSGSRVTLIKHGLGCEPTTMLTVIHSLKFAVCFVVFSKRPIAMCSRRRPHHVDTRDPP